MSTRIRESLLANYVLENILDLGITPRTTLHDAATAGAMSVTVEDASRFTRESTATWWDGTDEPETEIASVTVTATPHVITFASPLTADHAAGARLATNLCDYQPDAYSLFVVKGDPVVFVKPLGGAVGYVAQKKLGGPVLLHIQYNVSAEQRTPFRVQGNLWTRLQQRRCEDTLSDIVEAVAGNPHLRTATRGPIAQVLGDDSGRRVAEIAFRKFVSRDDVPLYGAAAHIVVQPKPQMT